jgi:hypothetical protein
LAAFVEPVSFANVLLLAATLHLGFRWRRRRFLEHAAFSMHVVSFVLLSSVTLLIAIRLRFLLGGYLFLTMGLIALWQFAYLAVAIRRFYLADGRWGSRLLSVATAMLIYVLNTIFMTAGRSPGRPLRSRSPSEPDWSPSGYFPLPLSCGTVQVAVPVTSLPARSRAVTVR